MTQPEWKSAITMDDVAELQRYIETGRLPDDAGPLPELPRIDLATIRRRGHGSPDSLEVGDSVAIRGVPGDVATIAEIRGNHARVQGRWVHLRFLSYWPDQEEIERRRRQVDAALEQAGQKTPGGRGFHRD